MAALKKVSCAALVVVGDEGSCVRSSPLSRSKPRASRLSSCPQHPSPFLPISFSATSFFHKCGTGSLFSGATCFCTTHPRNDAQTLASVCIPGTLHLAYKACPTHALSPAYVSRIDCSAFVAAVSTESARSKAPSSEQGEHVAGLASATSTAFRAFRIRNSFD